MGKKIKADDQVYREINTIFRKRRLKRIILPGITLILLVVLNYGCSYTYAIAQIARAKAQGVYPTIEDAVTRNLGKEYNGAHVESITSIHCSPNDPYGPPSVWFCTSRVKMDRIPDGYDKSEWLAGNFYVRVRDGWVFMGEGAFPGFVGRVMERYNLEGVNDWSTKN